MRIISILTGIIAWMRMLESRRELTMRDLVHPCHHEHMTKEQLKEKVRI